MRRTITAAILTVAMLVVASAGLACAADKTAVDDAMKRAKLFLKGQFAPAAAPGVAPVLDSRAYAEGPAALAGIALLLAGEKPGDPAVQAIANLIRGRVAEQGSVYHLALDIIFLDNLGEHADGILIQSMAARLIWGQTANGGWDYRCPSLDEAERARINALAKAARDTGKRTAVDEAGKTKLDDTIREIIEQGKHLIRPANGQPMRIDDNSNTQFAVIALWSARKYGVPVEPCFEKINQRFRNSQSRVDGGWSYKLDTPPSTPPMTCAGLIGLATATGVRCERTMKSTGKFEDNKFKPNRPSRGDGALPGSVFPDYRKDRAVMNALNYLGAAVGANARAGRGAGRPSDGEGTTDPLRDDLYFLWSLERVCVIYNLDKVGNVDWHDWGATHLVKTQRPEGFWYSSGGHYRNSIVDTAFALMFLSRGNIAKDLQKMIERSMKNESAGKKPEVRPAGDAESVPLTDALVAATPAKQREVIREYEREKGTKYTLALADAIPKLKGELQSAARDALAERMARLSARSLAGYLANDNSELVRAACLGAGMRDEKELIPELIKHLDDIEELVWRAAAVALRMITGKDFGPKKGATDAERDKAIKAWKEWYAAVEKAK